MAVDTRSTRRPIPTAPERLDPDRQRRQRTGRRIMVGLLALFLIAGAFEMFGSMTRSVTATGNGVTLTVTYPAVTRPGLPIRWEFEVTRPGGFDAPIELRTSFDYLRLLDVSNLEPDARSATGSGQDVVYTFDAPRGDTLQVSMDGNTEPGFHEVPPATTTVSIDGSDAASVTYRTIVVP
jgi:hypothetical protein